MPITEVQLSNQSFISAVSVERDGPVWGLAYAMPKYTKDGNTLGVGTYYNWSDVPSPGINLMHIPMLWDGNPSDNIPENYEGLLLWLNEPNLPYPQSDCSPYEAMTRLKEVKKKHPLAHIIGPNISDFAGDWMDEFWAYTHGVGINTWGVHAYTEGLWGVEHVSKMITEMHDLTKGNYVISEFASIQGSLYLFDELCNWIRNQPWITMAFPFTNRQPPLSPENPWVISHAVNLIDQFGNPTEMGKIFIKYSTGREVIR